MIIRLYETSEKSLVKQRAPVAAEGDAEYGCINLLMFTSVELRQRFGLRMRDSDATSAAELIEGLAEHDGRATDAAIREDRIVQLLEARPSLIPCFIGYQEAPSGKMLPLMTDGPDGRWSLFFSEKGAMTLVEYSGGQWRITPGRELVPEIRQRADPIAETKSFLLSGLKSARKMLVRSDDGPSR